MNPLQEKILKEFREEFEIDNFPDVILRVDIEKWLTITLEEVYKAGKEDGERLQKMSNDINNAKTY